MFRIKKHYFDGIDDKGNTIILYSAKLSLFGIPIPYSSFIISNSDGPLEKSFLKKATVITSKKASFHLLNSYQICGNWEKIDHGFSEILLQNNSKKLYWNCHHPKANFEVRCGDYSFYGLGYAETLEMNFAPWKLPITELKWGRFLSENHTIIWIEWIGKQPLKKVFWNGKTIKNVEISDDGLYFNQENATLKFENPITIKNEILLSIVDKYSFLKIFFSKKFLNSREMKFKSRSTLEMDNQTEKGFSLYEKVLWNM